MPCCLPLLFGLLLTLLVTGTTQYTFIVFQILKLVRVIGVVNFFMFEYAIHPWLKALNAQAALELYYESKFDEDFSPRKVPLTSLLIC